MEIVNIFLKKIKIETAFNFNGAVTLVQMTFVLKASALVRLVIMTLVLMMFVIITFYLHHNNIWKKVTKFTNFLLILLIFLPSTFFYFLTSLKLTAGRMHFEKCKQFFGIL